MTQSCGQAARVMRDQFAQQRRQLRLLLRAQRRQHALLHGFNDGLQRGGGLLALGGQPQQLAPPVGLVGLAAQPAPALQLAASNATRWASVIWSMPDCSSSALRIANCTGVTVCAPTSSAKTATEIWCARRIR